MNLQDCMFAFEGGVEEKKQQSFDWMRKACKRSTIYSNMSACPLMDCALHAWTSEPNPLTVEESINGSYLHLGVQNLQGKHSVTGTDLNNPISQTSSYQLKVWLLSDYINIKPVNCSNILYKIESGLLHQNKTTSPRTNARTQTPKRGLVGDDVPMTQHDQLLKAVRKDRVRLLSKASLFSDFFVFVGS